MIVKLSQDLNRSDIDAIDVGNYLTVILPNPRYRTMEELEKAHLLPPLGIWNSIRREWVEDADEVPAHLRGFLELRAK